MNTSIKHLSEQTQERLMELVSYILEDVPEAQFIILYGSYAGNTYIEYDQRVEFGLRTCYKSDFDIVVLTPQNSALRNGYTSIMHGLENASKKFYKNYHFTLLPTVQYLAMYVEEFNQAIVSGRYFYIDIAKDGIILYNSGQYEVEPIRKINSEQILQLSKEYYIDKYKKAESFLDGAKFYYGKNDYQMASFMLHQAVENYCLAIILSASLYTPKEHDIVKLIKETAKFTPVVARIFHENTIEDKRILELLQNAYVQSRHNKDFIVTQQDIEALLCRNGQLSADSQLACLKIVEEYEQRVNDDTASDNRTKKNDVT